MFAGAARRALAEQDMQVARRLVDATPPDGMQAAPVAPARGPMRLVADYAIVGRGFQHQTGSHWVVCGSLAAMVGQALVRHRARQGDAPFLPPFSAEQIEVADLYRTLSDWREGSAIKCSSIEARSASSGGSDGARDYMANYMRVGERLASLRQAVGGGMAMDIRRHMDRGNARAGIPDLVLVNRVVLHDDDLTAVLRRHGWAPKGLHRTELRHALCKALDRMSRVT